MSSWPLNGKKGGNRKHSKIDTLPPEMKATVEEMIMDGSATYSDIVAYQFSVMGINFGGVLGLVVEENGFLFIKGELHFAPPFCRSNSSLKLAYRPSSSRTTVAS